MTVPRQYFPYMLDSPPAPLQLPYTATAEYPGTTKKSEKPERVLQNLSLEYKLETTNELPGIPQQER